MKVFLFIQNKKKEIAYYVLIALLYLLATLILTYPLFFRINTHLAGDGGDAFVFSWNIWWYKYSVFGLQQSPYYTNMLYAPFGTSLFFHSLTPINTFLLSLPFLKFLSASAIYNLLLIFSFVASGLGMYFLTFYFTKNKLISFIAGFLFTFCPYHFAHSGGHLNLISMQWLPFFVLFLFKFKDKPAIRNAVFLILFLLLNTLTSWYYGIFCFFFLAIFLIYFCRKIDRIFIQRLVIGLVIFFILLSPILIPILAYQHSGIMIEGHPPDVFSADLLSFFVPGALMPRGGYFEDIWSNFSGNNGENANYVGYLILLSAIFIFLARKKDKNVIFFSLSALTFFIFSLGYRLHVNGKSLGLSLLPKEFNNVNPEALSSLDIVKIKLVISLIFIVAIIFVSFFIYFYRKNKFCKHGGFVLLGYFLISWFWVLGSEKLYFELFLPYFFIDKLPLFNYVGVVERFTVMLVLSLIILMAFFLMEVNRRIKNKKKATAVILLLFILMAFEYLPGTFSADIPASASNFYSFLSKEQGNYTIIDLHDPLQAMYYQTIHHKPIVGGLISRREKANEFFMLNYPVIGDIYRKGLFFKNQHREVYDMPIREYDRDYHYRVLKRFNIKYIINPLENKNDFLKTKFGFPSVYKDDLIEAFQTY